MIFDHLNPTTDVLQRTIRDIGSQSYHYCALGQDLQLWKYWLADCIQGPLPSPLTSSGQQSLIISSQYARFSLVMNPQVLINIFCRWSGVGCSPMLLGKKIKYFKNKFKRIKLLHEGIHIFFKDTQVSTGTITSPPPKKIHPITLPRTTHSTFLSLGRS